MTTITQYTKDSEVVAFLRRQRLAGKSMRLVRDTITGQLFGEESRGSGSRILWAYKASDKEAKEIAALAGIAFVIK